MAATELKRSAAVPVVQEPHPLTHETSSVGARPSSAAPNRIEANKLEESNTFRQFLNMQTGLTSSFCSMGAAEDGRAPTEELSCLRGWDFCSTGAAEDGRAPAEELSCLRGWDFCSMGGRGRSRSDRRAFVS
jgi:hypothetical protein